ncbi:hypothetical protein IXB50_04230 [Leptothoe spongobia TAU-MAC 1115]|uniref:Uncharacterized protein n=2 Tax=Leptothoe TaxID=2651725 RepID=A0A947DCW5_9CYAN|nr:hypothetical protein [Leptothoe spongobia TAU-MAC 1115]
MTAFQRSDDLIDQLLNKGYEPIPFPGCTTSVHDYLNWLKGKNSHDNHEVCEGFGITFRLKNPKARILIDLDVFFKSSIFKKLLEEKFNITRPTKIETGLQKYLQGYEISPHPDIRQKALTYMLNVNPSRHSEELNIHTHYLTFKPQKRFISEFWRYNEDYDRCWVPWEWCETIKRQCLNNSIVIFSPAWDTLHAVKLNYNHLKTQRTQFYGNFWYQDSPQLQKPQYSDFMIKSSPTPRLTIKKSKLKSYMSKFISHFRN